MAEYADGSQQGYLREPFRLFHLKDQRAQVMGYHYHEFDKVVLQLGGRVIYHVEGKRYFLKPMDLLMVGRGLLHRPEIDPGEPYERIVLWLDRGYLEGQSGADCHLDQCFRLAEERGFHLFRPQGEDRVRFRDLFRRLEEALEDRAFGAALLQNAALLQLLIALNRAVMEADPLEEVAAAYRFDPKMEEVTRFVAEHLGEDLSIDRLAGEFYISRYYLMHRFKEIYGCTVHQYIRQRRLHWAAEELRRGVPVMKVSMETGFRDYSAFLRAFRETYGVSPREWK